MMKNAATVKAAVERETNLALAMLTEGQRGMPEIRARVIAQSLDHLLLREGKDNAAVRNAWLQSCLDDLKIRSICRDGTTKEELKTEGTMSLAPEVAGTSKTLKGKHVERAKTKTRPDGLCKRLTPDQDDSDFVTERKLHKDAMKQFRKEKAANRNKFVEEKAETGMNMFHDDHEGLFVSNLGERKNQWDGMRSKCFLPTIDDISPVKGPLRGRKRARSHSDASPQPRGVHRFGTQSNLSNPTEYEREHNMSNPTEYDRQHNISTSTEYDRQANLSQSPVFVTSTQKGYVEPSARMKLLFNVGTEKHNIIKIPPPDEVLAAETQNTVPETCDEESQNVWGDGRQAEKEGKDDHVTKKKEEKEKKKTPKDIDEYIMTDSFDRCHY